MKQIKKITMANSPALEAEFINGVSDIQVFTVNGEMASITWYKKGDFIEVNGKYVERIDYCE